MAGVAVEGEVDLGRPIRGRGGGGGYGGRGGRGSRGGGGGGNHAEQYYESYTTAGPSHYQQVHECYVYRYNYHL